jgi:hypothetical protein
MNRQAFILILTLALFAGKAAAQCVDVGPAMSAICLGGTSGPLGGLFLGDATGAVWSDGGAGGTFSNNTGSTPGTATYTALSNVPGTVTLTLTGTGGTTCTPTFLTKTIVVNALPTPTISGPASACAGATGLTYSTEGSMSGYTWTISAGGAITAGTGTNTVTVSWNTAGAQTISVNYTDGNSCPGASPTLKNVTVNPLPVPIITGVALACAGATGVTYSTEGSMSSYTWAISAGGAITAGTGTSSVTVSWNTAGAQTISVNYTNGNSCTAASATVKNITVNPRPVPIISGPATAIEGSTGNVYTTENSMTGYTWSVSSGGVIQSGSGTNTISVKWNTTGAKTVSVNYTNGNSCTASSATIYNVTVNANTKPVASNVIILGDPRSGLTLYGSYVYSDAEDDPESGTTFQWYRGTSSGGAGSTPIALATSDSYKISDDDIGYYIGFSVQPASSTGTSPGDLVTTTTWKGKVTNTVPVATAGAITGSLNVNGTLIGHYSYVDAEGDAEGASSYQWYSSFTETGSYSAISDDTLLTHIIRMGEQGKWFKFSVKPRALTGSSPGILKQSAAIGPANSKPQATGVTIIGTAAVGVTLTGDYTFNDPDPADLENQTGTGTSYKWFRDGVEITGAVGKTYLVTSDDEGSKLKFEVIPVSLTGFPNTGDPVFSAETGIVPATGLLPAASQLCIDGKRATGEVLTGKYYFTNTSKDDNYQFRWMKGPDTIPGAHGTTYTLVAGDIDSAIYFVVYPFAHSKARTRGITQKSATLALITMTKDKFYETDRDTLLTGIPSGGAFSGEGIAYGKFTPSKVNTADNPFTINYQVIITNPQKSCTQIHSKDLTVNKISMNFTSVKPKYCQNDPIDTIYVRSIPKNYFPWYFTFSGPNNFIIEIRDSMVVVNPSLMRIGDKIDGLYFYAYTFVPYFNYIYIYEPLVVDGIPPMAISNLAVNDVFCSKDAAFQLKGVPSGGTFTGRMIRNTDIFDPKDGNRIDTVIYKLSSSLGCQNSITIPVTINPSPVVSFALVDTCILSGNDTTRFLNNTLSVDSVRIWEWEFSEAGGSSTSPLKVPSYLYKAGGLHNISLTATTINDCTIKETKTFDIGVKPVADFYWKSDCFHPSDSLMLFDTTYSPSFIVSRSWNFFDGDSLHVVKNPKYPKKAIGYLPIEYIVKTKYSGCHDTINRSVYIRPNNVLGTTDYFWNFENGKGGWVKDYESRNNWSFGKPDRLKINSAASGDSAWFTRYDIANQKVESSSIMSPCFDFTSIERPMISMKLWKRFDLNRDGGALQYKIGDSKDWVYVGTLDDGISWYNSTLIKGRPGGDQIGWTAGAANVKDATWTESKHKLDELVGKKDVKFRVAYGSDGTSQDNDGMAFDDIIIGSRTRGVLLEHFTNTTSSLGSTATALVTDLANRGTQDIINIQYHTNFPGSDPYYSDNPGDASARLLFYGLSRAPYSFIDGGTRKKYANIYDYLIADIDSNDLTRRSLINPSFSIALNSNVAGSILSVSGQIKALEAVSAENVTLYLAVTEKKNSDHTGALGETDFYNIFRKFIPDAGGISLKKTWAKDDIETITERTWTIEKIASNSKIDVIAFIQNNITKEIYQAQVSPDTSKTVGIDNIFENNGKGFSLYPNPVSDKLTIEFEKPLKSEAEIMIFDFKGTMIRIYKAGSGQSIQTIPDIGLKNGIYLVKIKSGGIFWGSRKLVVSNY